MIDPAIWKRLEEEPRPGPAGRVRRRILTLTGDRGVFAAVEYPDRRRLLVVELDEAPDLGRTEVSGVETWVERGRHPALVVALVDPVLEDVFTAFASDLAAVAEANPALTAGFVHRRVARWIRFLERTRGEGLAPAGQRGLWGELRALREMIEPAVGIRRAAIAWRGPAEAVQDFQTGPWAVEVKTTISGKDQRVRIASERQLDDGGLGVLLLLLYSIDARPGLGETLNAAVDDVRGLADADALATAAVEDALLDAGYSDLHRERYAGFGYTVREVACYRVQDGFPRITEAQVPSGVGRVSYEISASACAPFEQDLRTAGDLVRDARG